MHVLVWAGVEWSRAAAVERESYCQRCITETEEGEQQLLRTGSVMIQLSDEGGVQGAAVLCVASSSLKKLLYECGLLLLQLGDALALVRHLLEEEEGQ